VSGREGNNGGVLLEARGLEYAVGGATILGGIDLAVERGELVGVIGPNGAGKTTLLRLSCGLLSPTSGEVRLSGKPLAAYGHRERAKTVSFMSQDTPSDIGFTVMEVLLMGRFPHLRRLERETGGDFDIARRALSYVGLSMLEERPFHELSGGERQLVLFARVLVQETDLIVLDEPSSQLDIRYEDTIFSMAQELAEEGKAVLVTVHNLNVAAHYCGRLLLLERGKAAAHGSPEEVLEPSRLERVYGIRTVVSRAPATGSLTVSVVPFRASGHGARVHLIGGAGSAANLTRALYRMGVRITGGIAHERDTDETLWQSLGIEHRSVGAFSSITDNDIEAAAHLVEGADVTILCSFPIGDGNMANLSLARRARRLVILEPEKGDMARTPFSDKAGKLLNSLARTGQKMTHQELIRMLVQDSENAGIKPGRGAPRSRS
jgi:iron complex transport system ATP-binding protein